MRLKPLFVLFFVLFAVFAAVTMNNTIRAARLKRSAGMEKVMNTEAVGLRSYVRDIYNAAGLASQQLDSNVFFKAVTGYLNLEGEGKINEGKQIITVIDFSKPSVEKRLWVVDLKAKKVLFHTLVAHGKNTGENIAEHFSNIAQSNMSSLGFYVTGNTYIGKHGLSLLLNGVEQGFNTNARNRSVVVHGADYVSESFISSVGRLGRSQGCPALPEDIAPEVIKVIAEGTPLFIYYPDKKYEANTHYYDVNNALKIFNQDYQLGMK